MENSSGIGALRATLTAATARRTLRNGRLLATAALQHLVDDPALLAIQVSRRLPVGPRIAIGKTLERAGAVVPAAGALGSVMAGHDARAEQAVERTDLAAGSLTARLAGEVAILLGRLELIPSTAPAPTRARAAWFRGHLSESVEILETAGRGGSRYARRLRSELQLLRPGFRLPVARTARPYAATAPADGEPLRVLHLLTNSLPHTQSGYSLRSHRILTALRDRGIESVALTRTGYPVMVGVASAQDEDLVDGIRYVRTLPHRLPQTQQERLEVETARALELVAEFRPHVLHTTTNYQNALVAQAVSAATGLPWVFEVRGLMEQTWISSHRTPEARERAAVSEKAQVLAAREGELASEASAVVTLGSAMAREITRRGLDPEAITLVPNGVESALLDEALSPAEARNRIGLDLPPDAVAIGTVSALVGYEGLDVLLDAAARLLHGAEAADDAALRDRLHVVIAGDGAAAPALAAQARRLGIAERVHLPGRVAREDARYWVQALDVVTVPRLDVEVARSVTPQKPVEAMALGRPVVVSDLPALRETVTDADGGISAEIVPAGDPAMLADSLADLLGNDDRRRDLAARGRALAASRTWEALTDRYAEVYARALRAGASGDRRTSGR